MKMDDKQRPAPPKTYVILQTHVKNIAYSNDRNVSIIRLFGALSAYI